MIKRATKFNWVLEPSKFLSKEEAKKLLETARDRAEVVFAKRRKIPVRDYLIIDLALSTGLRVMEIAQLDCGDVFIRDGISSLLVRNGKCGKRRLVRFGESLKDHLNEYILWKQNFGEPTGPSDPLFLSSNTGYHLTTRAIQKAFKRIAVKAGLSAHYSIHCLRHTYACQLYKASSYNLRLVLCRSSIDGLLFFARLSPRARSTSFRVNCVEGSIKLVPSAAEGTDSSTPLRSARNDSPSINERQSTSAETTGPL